MNTPKFLKTLFKSRFDSFFFHIFFLQIAVGFTLAAIFVVLLFNEQASVSAHTLAPLWMQVLKPVQQQLGEGKVMLPRVATATAQIALIPGPPPDDANQIWLVPRYRALVSELRAEGLPVGRLAVSGETGRAITWLELKNPGRPVIWVGVRGDLEGTDIRSRGTLGLIATMLVFILASAWLTRRVAKPLLDLQASVKAYADTGDQPDASLSKGPIEIRQLAAQFIEFAAQRSQLDEAREVMLAGISHDLRSPLSRIRIAAELLPDLPAIAEKRDTIVRNTRMADKLVGSFLDLARAGAEPLGERVDLLALTKDWLADCSDSTTKSDLDVIRFDTDAKGPVWLEPASAIGLERLLFNLLDNASKYGKPPVEVSLSVDHPFATLRFRDHGPGISVNQMEVLRKPFFRGARDRGLPGTGLGLAIVERTMQRHGGEMAMHDAAPGLSVILRFPLERSPSIVAR